MSSHSDDSVQLISFRQDPGHGPWTMDHRLASKFQAIDPRLGKPRVDLSHDLPPKIWSCVVGIMVMNS